MIFDLLVIGAGPGGQKAAIQGAKSGARVALVDPAARGGGACVRQGTIPSKTLRETALVLARAREKSGGIAALSLPQDLQLQSCMLRKREVIDAHEGFIDAQLDRNGVERIQGKARLISPRTVEVVRIGRTSLRLEARRIVIATGSRPSAPKGIELDHEFTFDSDSILNMGYLPRSLVVIGGGVIASEYASVFAQLGVEVTLVHGYPGPLGFLDPELVEHFVEQFEVAGGRHLPNSRIEACGRAGLRGAITRLSDGRKLVSERVLVASGRVANADRIGLDTLGIELSARGHIPVDDDFETPCPGVYAVGDAVGPPALASASMEQGRRAACHALGLAFPHETDHIPVGVFTIPELASVGETEVSARRAGVDCVVGRAHFAEVARSHIAASPTGFLKLVVARDGRVIGVQIAGENAAELLSVGQLAVRYRAQACDLVDSVFNFPTLAEAYRIAGLSAVAALESSDEAVDATRFERHAPPHAAV
ncbi:MAG: Si-specific NAD(P)(+) transhydrogenase [Myxococcales bacterium]|nr:Si-specific NAD(P)(+) transhydrogenase [Myxococcales bacterium]